jgi:hypothetical protein
MNRIGVVSPVVVALLSLLLTGCPPKKDTSIGQPIDPNPQSSMASDPAARVGELRQQVAAFDQARRSININTPGDGRQQIAATFGELSRVLTTLEGPEPTGAFRQQVRIIDTNRARLSESSAELAAEPTINASFRAASRALERIAAQQYSEDDELRGLLDTFRGRVDELDSVRGPLHRLVVTQAFGAAGSLVERMAGVMEQRVGAADRGRREETPAEPAPQPAQPPAEQPAQPATPSDAPAEQTTQQPAAEQPGAPQPQ